MQKKGKTVNNSINFNKIRSHKGSQNNGFEELICQLARLHPPGNADYFVRKEGAGGDAGVECFWKLKDGSEHAWQAKYFSKLSELTDTQWKQISKSVETALKSHPLLKKYYICLPCNRGDQRQPGRKSQLDRWNKKVEEWKEIAKSKKMDVEFEFWGDSEILFMLNKDDPHFSGRALYWFNEPILQLQHLKNIAEKSKISLGERFSPELNVDLPIAESFDGVGLTPDWNKRFLSIANKWFEELRRLKDFLAVEANSVAKKKWIDIKDEVTTLESLLRKTVEENSLNNYENTNRLKENLLRIKTPIHIGNNKTEEEKKIQDHFNLFSLETMNLHQFFFSKDMTAFFYKIHAFFWRYRSR